AAGQVGDLPGRLAAEARAAPAADLGAEYHVHGPRLGPADRHADQFHRGRDARGQDGRQADGGRAAEAGHRPAAALPQQLSGSQKRGRSMVAATLDAPRPSGAVRKTLRRPQFWVGGIVLLITFGWYGVFVFAPMVKTLIMSFQRYRVLNP